MIVLILSNSEDENSIYILELRDGEEDEKRVECSGSRISTRRLDKIVDTINHTIGIISIGTLSYDDDIVGTFDNTAVADDVDKAVVEALARAHNKFEERKKLLAQTGKGYALSNPIASNEREKKKRTLNASMKDLRKDGSRSKATLSSQCIIEKSEKSFQHQN
jgi:DNA-binding PucR family transcriptional regulator